MSSEAKELKGGHPPAGRSNLKRFQRRLRVKFALKTCYCAHKGTSVFVNEIVFISSKGRRNEDNV